MFNHTEKRSIPLCFNELIILQDVKFLLSSFQQDIITKVSKKLSLEEDLTEYWNEALIRFTQSEYKARNSRKINIIQSLDFAINIRKEDNIKYTKQIESLYNQSNIKIIINNIQHNNLEIDILNSLRYRLETIVIETIDPITILWDSKTMSFKYYNIMKWLNNKDLNNRSLRRRKWQTIFQRLENLSITNDLIQKMIHRRLQAIATLAKYIANTYQITDSKKNNMSYQFISYLTPLVSQINQLSDLLNELINLVANDQNHIRKLPPDIMPNIKKQECAILYSMLKISSYIIQQIAKAQEILDSTDT